MFELSRQLAGLTYQHWITDEVFSSQWFLLTGVLLISYAVWLILLDKSRVRDILLLGSLCAVAYGVLEIILSGAFGFWQYLVSLLPVRPSIFVVNLTLGPVFHMLAMQYTSSWSGYLAWTSVAIGALAFILLPLYTAAGIIVFHYGWNYIYHFLMLLLVGIMARGIVVWLTGIEERHQAASHRVAGWHKGLQPAAMKPEDKPDDHNK